MGKDVIIACDFPNKEAVLAFLDKFVGHMARFALFFPTYLSPSSS